MNNIKKIDIHCHATNRELEHTVPKSATIDDIVEKMEEHNIEKTVVLATYFPQKGTGISNYRMLNWTKDKPQINLFGSLDFEKYFYQGYNELEELAENKQLKGIKIYTGYQKIDLESDKFRKIETLANIYSLPLMFHAGISYSVWKKKGIEYLKGKKIEDQPEEIRDEYEFYTPTDYEPIAKRSKNGIILSHLSKPYLDELIKVVKRNNNVYADMSGLLDSKDGEEYLPKVIGDIKKFLKECGPEKLLFGTDFPVQTHEHSIQMIEGAMKEYSIEDKKKVYYENAQRLIK